jgi:4'-phosphopantetheinyl transferase
MLLCDPLTDLPDVSASESNKTRPYVDIWWWPYNASVDWNRIRSALTLDEQTRAAAFHFEKDALAFMAGRYLQRLILSKYTSIPAKDLDIAGGPHGKPYLANAGIAFNLTSAEGLAAFAISRDCTLLGIDAEPVGAAIEPETLSLFGSPAELEIVSTLQGREQQSLLLSYWTLKESFLKAVGTGLMAAPDQLNVRLDRTTDAILIDNLLTADGTHWHHCLLLAPSEHLIAISVQSDQAELSWRQRKLPDPL